MCTVYTHGIVGLGLAKVCTRGRVPLIFWILAGLLPMLPDADALSWAPYGSIYGHRGFTHSLSFAVVVGLAAALATFRLVRSRLIVLWLFFFLATASHGVLDA